MRNPIRQAVEKFEERMLVEEEDHSAIVRLNDKMYRTCVTFYGDDKKDESNYELGEIDLFVNGETGKVEETPTYGGYDNEELVTPEDFLLWANTKADVYRYIKRDMKIIVLALHHANKQETAEIVITETDEHEHAHYICFYLKGTPLHFHYVIPKGEGEPTLVAKVQDRHQSILDIKTPVLTHWDTIKEKLENHPKIRLHVVTGS